MKRFGASMRRVLLCVMLFGLASCSVSVQAAGLKLNYKSMTMNVNETKTLKVTAKIKGKAIWRSSDKKVASVSKKGKVKAEKPGTAVITAKIKSRKASCKITVKKKAGMKALAKSNAKNYQRQIEEIAKYTNQYRKKHGRPALIPDQKLTEAACFRSIEMAKSGRLSHTRPDGSTPYDLIVQYGIGAGFAGENILYSKGAGIDAARAAAAWYNSSSHRANMLHEDFRRIGVGIEITEGKEVYYTQLFAD